MEDKREVMWGWMKGGREKRENKGRNGGNIGEKHECNIGRDKRSNRGEGKGR